MTTEKSSKFISYSQNLEDVMLWRALKHVEKGFYVDVGAWLPETDSVTKAFYKRGWSGINIEPDPIAYAMLVKERTRDINLHLAVSDHQGYSDLNFFKNTGLSTFRDDISDIHVKMGYSQEYVRIPIKTLKDIWEEYIQPDQDVHFLKIDVEGLEEAVLRGNDWLKHRPWVIVIEATLPNTQIETHESWENILLSSGYHFAYADGLNRFYVADEHRELIPAFKYPPNFFDDFKINALEKIQMQFDAERVRASQLENNLILERSRVSQLENELYTVYSTLSWRITYPLRVAFCSIKHMKSRILRTPQALKGIMIQMLIGPFSIPIRFVISRPYLKHKAVIIIKRSQRIDERVYRFFISHGLIGQSTSVQYQPVVNVAPELGDLSVHARCIYINLKNAIKRKKIDD